MVNNFLSSNSIGIYINWEVSNLLFNNCMWMSNQHLNLNMSKLPPVIFLAFSGLDGDNFILSVVLTSLSPSMLLSNPSAYLWLYLQSTCRMWPLFTLSSEPTEVWIIRIQHSILPGSVQVPPKWPVFYTFPVNHLFSIWMLYRPY